MRTRKLVFCAVAVALAYLTSYIRLFELPWGGSVTLCSMLFIVLIGYWYGPAAGMATGFVYGILQFMQEPYMLSPFQVCCDYLFAFAALGLSGFFRKRWPVCIPFFITTVSFCWKQLSPLSLSPFRRWQKA